MRSAADGAALDLVITVPDPYWLSRCLHRNNSALGEAGFLRALVICYAVALAIPHRHPLVSDNVVVAR
jgi:hypothetical protein